MPEKQKTIQIAERLLYLVTVAAIPNIPLFFLYGRNSAQGLLFKHFLILGGVLALGSLIFYLLVSKFALGRRRTVILVAILWSAFWFFDFFNKIISRGNSNFSKVTVAVCLLTLILIIGIILRLIKVNRALANVIAIWLCMLFVFNFVPEAVSALTSENRRIENEKTGGLPYKIKSEFHIDPNLPHPNIYWLHMDGMMSFEGVERYFDDSQAALKEELAEYGFVINEGAKMEGGLTAISLPAMTSPTFYDSYLAAEFAKITRLTRVPRMDALYEAFKKSGFSLFKDIHPHVEIVKAFSDAGFTTIATYPYIEDSEDIDAKIVGTNVITTQEANSEINKLLEFKTLIVDASALSVIKPIIDRAFTMGVSQPIPEYPETVSKYITGSSHLDSSTATMVRAMKYAASIQEPAFIYYANSTAHYHNYNNNNVVGEVTYDNPPGRIFIFDENGNLYKERLDDPNDVRLYLPQHKYTVKQMMAQIETIIENDPNAVIVIQGDHGIHGIGPGEEHFDTKFLSERGYTLEDQLNLNTSVISAVRIPPQYGKLTQPLDPLDIARYLVNHFVGGGNYDYLHYTE